MHRDIITHVCVAATDFVLTASRDGHIKFWKKMPKGIEFVKHFKAHVGAIAGLAVSPNGEQLVSVGADKTMKIFDVVNFGAWRCGGCVRVALTHTAHRTDMVNMLKLPFAPGVCTIVSQPGAGKSAVAVYARSRHAAQRSVCHGPTSHASQCGPRFWCHPRVRHVRSRGQERAARRGAAASGSGRGAGGTRSRAGRRARNSR
jgi:WD40 repeat protein